MLKVLVCLRAAIENRRLIGSWTLTLTVCCFVFVFLLAIAQSLMLLFADAQLGEDYGRDALLLLMSVLLVAAFAVFVLAAANYLQ